MNKLSVWGKKSQGEGRELGGKRPFRFSHSPVPARLKACSQTTGDLCDLVRCIVGRLSLAKRPRET